MNAGERPALVHDDDLLVLVSAIEPLCRVFVQLTKCDCCHDCNVPRCVRAVNRLSENSNLKELQVTRSITIEVSKTGWPGHSVRLLVTTFKNSLIGLLLEIGLVSLQERWDILGQDIDFAANLLCFSRLHFTDAEVAVQALCDSLEKFLIGLEGDGEDPFLVFAEAADEAVAGDQWTERTGIYISSRDVFWTPDLTGFVAGFGDPRLRGQRGEFAVDEEEGVA